MADSSDVETALVAIISGMGGALATAKIYRGWPQASLLDTDLAAGIPHITVTATKEMTNTTRYLSPPVFSQPVALTLTASAISNGVAFGGSGGAGQVVGLIVQGIAWAYRLNASDTPQTTAAALAALIPNSVANGANLTATGITAIRIGRDCTVSQEVKREQRRFQIVFWCPSPALRDLMVSQTDPQLASITFLALPDGSCGRMRASGDTTTDHAENATLWRRDLLYDIEFPTLAATSLPQMLFGTAIMDLNDSVLLQTGDLVMPNVSETDGQGNVLCDGDGHVLGDFQ